MKNIKKYSILFIIFMIIIMIMFILSLLIDTTNIKNEEDYDEFEKNINLVLEKINQIYITNGEYVGIKITEYAEKDNYKNEIEDIQKIYNKNILTEDYYFLDNDSKKQLGIDILEDYYVVNYKFGEVYSINPIRYNGKLQYTTQIVDANIGENKEYAYNIPIIPKGFRYLTGNWDTGFVITDDNGNEFVWIPVGVLNTTKPSAAFKKYYDSYEGVEKETDEYLAIKNSIDKYGGFYIGRYEASLQGATVTSSKGTSNILQVKKEVMPISNVVYSTEKYEYVYNNKNTELINISIPMFSSGFYGYTTNGELKSNNIIEIFDETTQTTTKTKEEIKGALEMARSMSEDYSWDSSIHSTLIYAEQLDTLLKIIEKNKLLDEKKVEEKDAITENNALWGNFIDSGFRYSINNTIYTKNKNEGELLPTGVTTYKLDEDIQDNQNNIFNIFDLAGNLNELTMEEELDTYIVVRGGSFDNKGSNNITEYKRITRNEIGNNIGIRIVMYID